MANEQTVVLKKTHTHQGKSYQPGDSFPVSPVVAIWLEQQEIIEPPAVKSKAAKSTQESK